MKSGVEYSEEKPVLLVFPFGLLSHYLRCLTLAKYFKPYFRILFVYNERFDAFIQKEGFGTFTCRSLDPDVVLEGVKRYDFSWLNEPALEAVYHDQVRAIGTLRPAAVLGDTSVTLKMAAEKTGTFFISLMNGYMTRHYAQARKISRTHPLHRLMKNLPAGLGDRLTQKGESLAFYSVHSAFKKIRRREGLPHRRMYLEELEGDYNLVCDLDAFFPQKELPYHYRQIAPLFYHGSEEAALPTATPSADRKTIFVSMGSSGDWEHVRFLNDPYFSRYNIVTAGDAGKVLDAPHITGLPFIDVHTLFPQTDLVICHGGNGTLYQALLYGIPVLCSTSHFEQEWNVDAMERLQLGRSLDGLYRMEEFKKLIDQWLGRKERGLVPSYREEISRQIAALPEMAEELMAEILEPQLRSGIRA